MRTNTRVRATSSPGSSLTHLVFFHSLGSFVDYSVPYTNDCRLIHNAMQLALQQERQRDAAAATKTLSFGDDTKE